MIREQDYNTILAPIVTEKSTNIEQYGQYVFKVDRAANKKQIKSAIEKVFDVKVKAVRVVNVKPETIVRGGRKATRKGWKKAYVTCEAGHSIQMLDE